MKRSNSWVLAALIIASFFVSSCTKWKDGSPGNVWMEGLWIVFWVQFIGALICWIQCYRGHKSPFMQHDEASGQDTQIAPRTPITKVQYFPWAVGLTITTALTWFAVAVWGN